MSATGSEKRFRSFFLCSLTFLLIQIASPAVVLHVRDFALNSENSAEDTLTDRLPGMSFIISI